MAKRINYADDDKDTLLGLLRLRTPALLIGLILGVGLSLLTAQLEEVLAKNVEVAFFIPFVVYMASAVGTQTQSIYTRDLRSGKASFKKYLIKETMLGLVFSSLAAIVTGFLTYLWFSNISVSTAISVAMFLSVGSAPLIALATSEFFELEHSDPAASAGPIATVIQDALTILIYSQIVRFIIL